jgi:hypothetical protein
MYYSLLAYCTAVSTVTARTVGVLILLSGMIQNKVDGVKLPFRPSFTASVILTKKLLE